MVLALLAACSTAAPLAAQENVFRITTGGGETARGGTAANALRPGEGGAAPTTSRMPNVEYRAQSATPEPSSHELEQRMARFQTWRPAALEPAPRESAVREQVVDREAVPATFHEPVEARRGAEVRHVDWNSPYADPFGEQALAHSNEQVAAPARRQFVAQEPGTREDSGFPSLEPLPNRERDYYQPTQPLFEGGREGNGNRAAAAPCDRVYNRTRDCCEEDGECAAVHRKLRERPITSISLDISPKLDKPPTTAKEREAYERKLAAIPQRTWRSCSGEFLAEGVLVDFRRGMVHIRERNGQVLPFPTRELSADDLCFVTAYWELPGECPLWEGECISIRGGDRCFTPSLFTWKAAGLAHKPLYFEQMQLERYGHTAGPIFQPIISGAHFFLNVAILPYKMGMYPPNECQYALGYYRPGNCAPWQIDPLALSLRGALYQGAALGAGVAILP